MTTNNTNNPSAPTSQPTKIPLTDEQTAGHADHWHILTDNIHDTIPNWLQSMIERAAIPRGINPQVSPHITPQETFLLLSEEQPCHINQILQMNQGKPQRFINAYPCVNSPYGIHCKIDRIIVNEQRHDAVLRLQSKDGTIVYAFDQLYTANCDHYQKDTSYFVNLSAWAYEISKSDQEEVVRVEDPDAIRYHRAFNDIVAANDGQVPDDIQEQIKQWQPESNEPLAPVEINLGNMCAYLFGDTLGQEDEAWCQGQVLGKQQSQFYDQTITLFDVVILREPDTEPMVVRIATPSSESTKHIQVHDYIQANIWLQAAIFEENQSE